MRLSEHLLLAERTYWLEQLEWGQSMRDIAKASGLSYRQMYYHMRKVGVRSERKRTPRALAGGRFLTPEDTAKLSLLSMEEKMAVIGMIVNDLRARHSHEIARMRRARVGECKMG